MIGNGASRPDHCGPSAPDAVYARRWGDCKEKALLMVTMLRALGIEASPALVNTERRDDIDRPATDQHTGSPARRFQAPRRDGDRM